MQPPDDFEPLLSIPEYAPAATLTDTTRRLCCAPYVDLGFGDAVIREVIESERRAVPPSYGFDLDPVVRHCLRARRLMLLRYTIVTALLLAGICVNLAWTLIWLGVCAAGVALRSKSARELPRAARTSAAAVGVVVLLCLLGNALGVGLIQRYVDPDGYRYAYEDDDSVWDGILSAGLTPLRVVASIALALGTFAVLYWSRRHIYGVLTTELAPGAPATAPPTGSPRVERRLTLVSAMQRGNVSVHDIDPYAGAGHVEHGWSFAVALRSASTEPVTIDGRELNRQVHDAIIGLRDERLREGERVPNVFVVPYVAADGYRRRDDPLIDPSYGIPRTLASPETITAIEECPQGGLRHYLRAVVPASGKQIRTPDGRLVLQAQESGIGVTAFVHLAVEGGMLYTEFVATVMPQVRPLYHLVDNLRPERVDVRAAYHTLLGFFRDNLLAPVHMVRIGWDSARLSARMSRSARVADEFRYYDYGARFSVRELAAQVPTVKFMQLLDQAKYIKLLDRAVTEAVIRFLDAKGVDTSEFRTATMMVANNFGTQVFHGGIQNLGGRNVNAQTNVPRPPQAKG